MPCSNPDLMLIFTMFFFTMWLFYKLLFCFVLIQGNLYSKTVLCRICCIKLIKVPICWISLKWETRPLPALLIIDFVLQTISVFFHASLSLELPFNVAPVTPHISNSHLTPIILLFYLIFFNLILVLILFLCSHFKYKDTVKF